MSRKHRGRFKGDPVTHQLPNPAGGAQLETFVPWTLVKRGVKKQVITPLEVTTQSACPAMAAAKTWRSSGSGRLIPLSSGAQADSSTSQSGMASRMLSRRMVSLPTRSGRERSSERIHSPSMRVVHLAAKKPVVARLSSASVIANGYSTHASSNAV